MIEGVSVADRTIPVMSLEPKYLRSVAPLLVGDRHVKRYHVSNTITPIDGAIASARERRTLVASARRHQVLDRGR